MCQNCKGEIGVESIVKEECKRQRGIMNERDTTKVKELKDGEVTEGKLGNLKET